MKWLQNGNLAKLVAFFVISVVITCTVSFAANGWESFVNDSNSSDGAINDANTNSAINPGTEEEQDPTGDIPAVLPVQKYYHSITGLETDAQTHSKRPICFVFSSLDPLYGISSSYLTIEIPTEYGNTRLLCFTDDAKTLGKIGSLAPGRGYISNLAAYFGGILLCYGNDDGVKYDHITVDDTLDFSATPGYCYTEYNSFIYTNADLVNALLNNSKTDESLSDAVTLPYGFLPFGERLLLDGDTANCVCVTYTEGNTTQLIYSPADKSYFLTKNNSVKSDLLNDKAIKYDNAFILYADSTTYESADTTQLIMDTYSHGTGLYMTDGKYVEITWEKDAAGSLVFYNNGELLNVNRGTTYIGFVKSSMKDSVKIS